MEYYFDTKDYGKGVVKLEMNKLILNECFQ